MTSTKLLTFENDAGPIFVEVDDVEARGGPLPASRSNDSSDVPPKKFADAVNGIKPIAEAVIGQLATLSPDQATVEFGIKFSAMAGVVVAKASSEGHCKITLTWNRPKS